MGLISSILVSTFMVCAVPPPVAMVQGPGHVPAYLALFRHLHDTEWKNARIRGGDKSRRGRVILWGYDRTIEDDLKADGWRILIPPYMPKVATMIMVVMPLQGNERGIARMIEGFVKHLMPGGFFVLQPFTFEEDAGDLYRENARQFLMRGFEQRLGGVKIREKYYDVYQRRAA